MYQLQIFYPELSIDDCDLSDTIYVKRAKTAEVLKINDKMPAIVESGAISSILALSSSSPSYFSTSSDYGSNVTTEVMLADTLITTKKGTVCMMKISCDQLKQKINFIYFLICRLRPRIVRL